MYSNISILPNSNIYDRYDEDGDGDGYNRSFNSTNTISKEIIKWTEEEDNKLLTAIEEVRANKSLDSFWKEVASKVGTTRDHGK
jgi:hypothetical protein